MITYKKINWFWLVITIVMRIFSATYIYYDHFWGLIVFVFLDGIDSQFFLYLANLNRKTYEKLDKYIDWIGYMVMIFVSINSQFFIWLFLTLLFRLIGQLVFVITKNEKAFLYFPNFFEVFFFWFVSLKSPSIEIYRFWFVIVVLFVPLRELVLHLLWPNLIKSLGLKDGLFDYFRR